jgi:hypothetical protein
VSKENTRKPTKERTKLGLDVGVVPAPQLRAHVDVRVLRAERRQLLLQEIPAVVD